MRWLARWRRPAAPAARGGGPVAVVLQATGSHAWAVSGGWVRAAEQLGVLGAALAPRARWGAARPEDDGGLAAWLRRADPGQTALLLGFDWHSQALHASPAWRRRLAQSPARKLVYVQESLQASLRQTGSEAMQRSFRAAAAVCDGVLYADPADRPLVEASGKPALWLPFGVDPEVFRAEVAFAARRPAAFFRGKVDAFADPREYADRRRVIGHLRARGLLEVVPYTPGEIRVAELVADFNRFQVALNVPSVFAGHPTRVLEGMACGCCVVTNRTGVAEVDALFEDGAELAYYSDEAEAEELLRRLLAEPGRAAAIAERGRRAATERFALRALLERVLRWADEALPRPSPGQR